MKLSNGFIHLSASSKGLSIGSRMGIQPVFYKWEQISKIILTKVLVHRDAEGVSRSKNIGIIYFHEFTDADSLGFIERSKLGISRTPENRDIVNIDLPQDDFFMIQQKLKYFSLQSLIVEICSKVEFDYSNKKNSEVFKP